MILFQNETGRLPRKEEGGGEVGQSELVRGGGCP